jgi:hypothetical protein
MDYLEKSDLELVHPTFRHRVIEAWECGEKVPQSVIYLSEATITADDIAWAEKCFEKLSHMDATT